MRFVHWLWLPVILTSVALIGCRKGSETTKERIYDVKGTGVAVDPKKPSVKLDHKVIPGLMEAMVMEFEVADPNVLKGIKPGEKVQGKLRVETGNNVITHLEKAP